MPVFAGQLSLHLLGTDADCLGDALDWRDEDCGLYGYSISRTVLGSIFPWEGRWFRKRVSRALNYKGKDDKPNFLIRAPHLGAGLDFPRITVFV